MMPLPVEQMVVVMILVMTVIAVLVLVQKAKKCALYWTYSKRNITDIPEMVIPTIPEMVGPIVPHLDRIYFRNHSSHDNGEAFMPTDEDRKDLIERYVQSYEIHFLHTVHGFRYAKGKAEYETYSEAAGQFQFKERALPILEHIQEYYRGKCAADWERGHKLLPYNVENEWSIDNDDNECESLFTDEYSMVKSVITILFLSNKIETSVDTGTSTHMQKPNIVETLVKYANL